MQHLIKTKFSEGKNVRIVRVCGTVTERTVPYLHEPHPVEQERQRYRDDALCGRGPHRSTTRQQNPSAYESKGSNTGTHNELRDCT
jgi:hypothetical protein